MDTRDTTDTNEKTSKTLSRDEYLKLVGLLTLSKRHRDALDDIRYAALTITEEGDADGGHTDEAIWSSHDISAADLLRKLGIVVEGGF